MADSYQVVIDDTSPALDYFPFADTLGVPDLFAGWNPYYSDSGFASTPDQLGNGTSFHVTSLDGAVFAVQWAGQCAPAPSLARPHTSRDILRISRHWYSPLRLC